MKIKFLQHAIIALSQNTGHSLASMQDKPNKPIFKHAKSALNFVSPERQASAIADQVNLTLAPISVKEVDGPKGLEPTRYGDWESKGRCYDF